MITALAASGALFCMLWNTGAFLPGWVRWEEQHIFDGSGSYEISLTDRTVHVMYEGKGIFTSPANVQVQQILSLDIDRDERDELIVLCWKRGRYGKHRPFWVERDEAGWSQHLFVYEYEGYEIKPKWMSSYIGQDVAHMTEGGNKSGEKWLLLTDPEDRVNCWQWGSWGFVKEDKSVSFSVFGDNIIHAPIYTYGLNNGGNFDFLYEHVKGLIEKSDISVINQETPLVEDPREYGDFPRFGTPVQVGEAIVNAGFDVALCATNHALDRGEKGIRTTKEFFEGRDVMCLGIRTSEEKVKEPYRIICRKGAKFALLNYTYGLNGNPIPEGCTVYLLEDEAQILADIEKASDEADFVVVFVHWGTENSTEIDEFQQKWTEVFRKSQADVVVGCHPHALQICETLRREDGHNMLVYYSIGNFVSAQPEKSCVKGGVASFTVTSVEGGYEITAYDLKPLQIFWQEGGGYTAAPEKEFQK